MTVTTKDRTNGSENFAKTEDSSGMKRNTRDQKTIRGLKTKVGMCQTHDLMNDFFDARVKILL